MLFEIRYLHFSESKALSFYTQKKLESRMGAVGPSIDLVKVTFERNHTSHIATCLIHAYSGLQIHVIERGHYLYDCVDRMAYKIGKILEKNSIAAGPVEHQLSNEEEAYVGN